MSNPTISAGRSYDTVINGWVAWLTVDDGGNTHTIQRQEPLSRLDIAWMLWCMRESVLGRGGDAKQSSTANLDEAQRYEPKVTSPERAKT